MQHQTSHNGMTDIYRRQLALGAPWERSQQETASSWAPIPSATAYQQQPTSNTQYGTNIAEHNVKRQRRTYETPTSHPSTPGGYRDSRPPNGYSFTQLPINIHPTCRLDTILFDFATSARRRISEGASMEEVVGPEYPVLNAMFEPDSPICRFHPLSELLIECLRGFSAISRLPEKLAVIWCMYRYSLWYIAPSAETYRLIPPSHLPVEEQLKVAHPIWIDYIPWPKMRAKMVYQYPMVPLDNFFYPYTTTLSMQYKSEDMQACVYSDQNGCTRVHPDLAAHCSNDENWTVGPFFAQSLPKLADTCSIRSDSRGGVE